MKLNPKEISTLRNMLESGIDKPPIIHQVDNCRNSCTESCTVTCEGGCWHTCETTCETYCTFDGCGGSCYSTLSISTKDKNKL